MSRRSIRVKEEGRRKKGEWLPFSRLFSFCIPHFHSLPCHNFSRLNTVSGSSRITAIIQNQMAGV